MGKASGTDFDFSVLRDLRGQRQLSLERLAEETGIGCATLARIESNQNQPNLQTLRKLAAYFGLTPAHLLEMATSFVVERSDERAVKLAGTVRREVAFSNVRLRVGSGRAGESGGAPHHHEDDYQINWVLRGRMAVTVRSEEFVLEEGQAVKFNAAFEHCVRYLDDSEFLVLLLPKRRS